jgi:uncharacterized protein with GYD domain
MVTHVTLYRFTEQGAKNIASTVERADRISQGIGQMGGRLLQVLWLQGQYDILTIAEWPDDEIGTAGVIGLVKAGNVTSETLRAFDREAMLRILAKVPQG